MSQGVSQLLIAGVFAMSIGLGTGCSHQIELTSLTNSALPASVVVPSDARMPVLLETIRVTHNGSSIAPPAILERQVLGAIEATRLFSQHYQSGYTQPPKDQARITMRLSIDNLVEPHAGQAAWHGFLIGASMFTLAPFLSLNYDYGAHMSLEIERWDGQTRQYTATSNGSAHYKLFGANPEVIEQLKGQVTEASLSSLLDQMIQDSTFYLASHEQSPGNSIRTVSIGIRHSSPRAIPISQPASDAPAR